MCWKLRIEISCCYFWLRSRNCSSNRSILFLWYFQLSRDTWACYAQFEILKNCISPKIKTQGQTSKYDRLAHTPRTQDRCPHRVSLSVSEPPKCWVRLKIKCQWSFYEVCGRFYFIYTSKFTTMQSCHIITKQQSKSAYTWTLNFRFVS